MYEASHWRCALGAPVIPFLAMLINSGQWGTGLKGIPHMVVIVAHLLGRLNMSAVRPGPPGSGPEPLGTAALAVSVTISQSSPATCTQR